MRVSIDYNTLDKSRPSMLHLEPESDADRDTLVMIENHFSVAGLGRHGESGEMIQLQLPLSDIVDNN